MYYSQVGQDRYLNEHIFHNKRNGIFIDIGAHDGITFSNTYFFEKELDWIGICVEPNPKIYSTLSKNRKCICENCCISNEVSLVDFLQIDGYSEMLSGIISAYDERHLKRIDNELKRHGGNKQIIQIFSTPLHELCLKHNISNIDFCSIDVEGAEEYIIKGIDFNKINIDYFIIENNYQTSNIEKYLNTCGYKLINKIDSDDLYGKI